MTLNINLDLLDLQIQQFIWKPELIKMYKKQKMPHVMCSILASLSFRIKVSSKPSVSMFQSQNLRVLRQYKFKRKDMGLIFLLYLIVYKFCTVIKQH